MKHAQRATRFLSLDKASPNPNPNSNPNPNPNPNSNPNPLPGQGDPNSSPHPSPHPSLSPDPLLPPYPQARVYLPAQALPNRDFLQLVQLPGDGSPPVLKCARPLAP